MSIPSALIGAIVFAWFPHDDQPHHPGPKFRPSLVIDVDLNSKCLRVAYGTSQKTDCCHRGEIAFRKDEISGLTKDTKFCLGKSKWIPMSAEYLSQTHGNGGMSLSVLGQIPAKYAPAMLSRLQEVI